MNGNGTNKLVLYAEDNSDDAFFSQQSTRALGVKVDLRVVPDGTSVIGWLTGQGIYVNPQVFPMPALVILDAELPYLTAFETLSWIREQQQFKNLPVIIHSASTLQQDIDKARGFGATDYIIKDSHCTRLAHYLKVFFHSANSRTS